MIGYLDKTIRPLVLIMSKISGYIKTFKIQEGSNKLISFRIDGKKLLEKYKAIWTKIEDLKKYYVKHFTSLWWQIYKN